MDSTDHYSLLNSANIKVIVPLIYGVPSLMFYLVVVFVLFRRLKSRFYRFFAIAGVTDIVAWVLTFILRRARFSPIFFGFYEALPEKGFVPSLVLSWWYHNNYSQMLATLFMSATRFTAVMLPFQDRKTPRGLINGIVGILYGVPVTSMNVAIFYKLRVLGAHRRSNAEVKLLLLTTVITAYCVVNVAVYAIF